MMADIIMIVLFERCDDVATKSVGRVLWSVAAAAEMIFARCYRVKKNCDGRKHRFIKSMILEYPNLDIPKS